MHDGLSLLECAGYLSGVSVPIPASWDSASLLLYERQPARVLGETLAYRGKELARSEDFLRGVSGVIR